MDNQQTGFTGENYYIHVDGLHHSAYKTLGEVYKALDTILTQAVGHVEIESRDNWLERAQ